MDEGGNNDNADETRRIATWSALATHMTPSIQRVVEFAKRVPGKKKKFSQSTHLNECWN
jgi:hypothetical protein